MGATKAARVAVATALDAAATLSAVTVWSDRQPVDNPDAFTLVVGTGKVEPSPVAAFGRVVTVEVWLVSPSQAMGDGDDALDDLLDLVLAVLDQARIEWTKAEPALWRESNLAYRIEVET